MQLSTFCTVSVLKALADAMRGARRAGAGAGGATGPLRQVRATATLPVLRWLREPAAAIPQQLAVVRHRAAAHPDSRRASASPSTHHHQPTGRYRAWTRAKPKTQLNR
jgi:hypothetical protein